MAGGAGLGLEQTDLVQVRLRPDGPAPFLAVGAGSLPCQQFQHRGQFQLFNGFIG